MTIRDISFNDHAPDPLRQNRKVEKPQHGVSQKKADSVELSEEAKELARLEKQRKMALVESRIRTGFYNQRDVAEKTAEKIIREVKEQ